MSNPYSVLGVTPSASREEVKNAYRKLCKRLHPDVCHPKQRAQAEEAFKAISEAYTTLCSPGGGATTYSWQRRDTAQRVAWAYGPKARYSNGAVALAVCLPLIMFGIQFGWAYDAERLSTLTWRRNGILSPPVNPWLRDDQQPRVRSRFAKADDCSSNPQSNNRSSTAGDQQN